MDKELLKVKMSPEGRICIPINFRNDYGIKAGDEYFVEVEKNNIILHPVKNHCKICGNNIKSDLIEISDDVYICKNCKNLINK